MVKVFFVFLIYIVVYGWGFVMLLNELNLIVIKIVKFIGDVCFLVGVLVLEFYGFMMGN